MDEHVVNFRLVDLEKIESSDLRRLYSKLLEVYSEDENVYVASRWKGDNLSFDVYRGKDFSMGSKSICNVIGTDELRAVALFVKNCNRLETDLVIGEVEFMDNTPSFRIFY